VVFIINQNVLTKLQGTFSSYIVFYETTTNLTYQD